MKERPEVGAPLEGNLYNTITRGARLKKVYMESRPTSAGKALINGSKVYTPDGPKKIEDIKYGDAIFGEDGNIYQVEGVYPQGTKPLYEVIFNDGTSIKCNDEHLWNFKTIYTGDNESSEWQTATLREIIDHIPILYQNNYNIYIPTTQPLKYPKKDLPISPYLFGALIGDGYNRCGGGYVGFVNSKEEIVNRVEQEAKAYGTVIKKCYKKTNHKYELICSRDLQRRFTDLGLDTCHPWDKFIPDMYKYSAIADRVALLQAIFDTGASITKEGIKITLKSKRLITDIQEICESLGCIVYYYETEHTGYYIGDLFIDCGPSYSLTIEPNPDLQFFTLNTPIDKARHIKCSHKKIIVEIKDWKCQMPMTCIRTSNPTHLFITDHHIITHNSRSMVGNACKLAYPMRWDYEAHDWIPNGTTGDSVLYITTELEHNEIQTMILAYISGVNEDKILNSTMNSEEQERVNCAAAYIKNNHNFIIEFMPNPTLNSIRTIIKKHVYRDNVRYVLYDYCHISTGLTMGRDKQTRDDVILMYLVDTLKQLANELDIFIGTASQLSGDYYNDGAKNETMLRGARSLADKVDCGMITMRCSRSQEELGHAIAIQLGVPDPNFITYVYKNRRGKLTNCMLWRNIDLGTCRTTDLFLTTNSGELIDTEELDITVQQSTLTSGFSIIDQEGGIRNAFDSAITGTETNE